MASAFSLVASPLIAKDSASPVLPESKARIFTYENGLTLIVEEDRSAPVASVQAWAGTGSVHEGDWMGAGLSHILEHMLFKGTEARPPGAIAREVQEQGGYINAYTSFDRTVYWIDVPSAGAMKAVEILADAMMNATLPEDEYVKEQEVIRREFAMGFDDANRQSSQLMLRTVFSESPFRHPVIGYLDVYNKLTRKDVLDYYKERYVPNNLTFVVVGDVDAEKIHENLGKLFEKFPRRALEPVFVATEPDQLGRRDAHEEFPTELSRLYLAWRIPGLTNPDTPALEVLGEILGSGRSSRLNREIRERRQMAHSISAGMFSLQNEGVFVVSAMSDPARRVEVEKAALAELAAIKKDGVTEAELDRARRSILSGQLGSMTTMRGKASDLGSSWLLARNLNFSKHYLEAISRVTAADVQRVANTYLRDERLSVTSLNPPGSLAAESESQPSDAASEIQKITLPNGLRLLVREDPRLPLVSINAVFRGGLLAEKPETNGITRLFSKALLKGTESRSAEQIADEIEGVGGSLSSDSGNNSFSVAVDVMSPDLGKGIEILADVLKNPTFPEREVELEKASLIAAIKAEEEQPTAVARNLLRSKLFGGHPYGLRNLGSSDSVNSLTADQLRAFHKEFVAARNGVIAIFGDVKADEVRRLAEKYLGGLPEGRLAFETVPVPEPLGGTQQVGGELDKQQAIVMTGFLGAEVASEDRLALELINEASNNLGSRFFNRIREEMGLAYFVGAAQFYGLAPGAFIFYLGTDPKKAGPVQEAFQKEIATLAREGLTADELDRAKKKLLGSEAIKNQSNAAFAASVAVEELMGLGWDSFLRRPDAIEKITLDDTRRVASKYLSTPNRVDAVVQPRPSPAATNN
ncbi:MAG: pitrilysin family protein [Terrimicrobiaceae bacterium]|nr:pitrilysin family protein [Terrimicrobiaceae bacterium]